MQFSARIQILVPILEKIKKNRAVFLAFYRFILPVLSYYITFAALYNVVKTGCLFKKFQDAFNKRKKRLNICQFWRK